jgi:hypothetical protein
MKLIFLLIFAAYPPIAYFITETFRDGTHVEKMAHLAIVLTFLCPFMILMTGFAFHVLGRHDKASRWIPIKDEEPEQGRALWYYAPIFDDSPNQWLGEYYGNGSFGGHMGHLGGNEVTHWQYVEKP